MAIEFPPRPARTGLRTALLTLLGLALPLIALGDGPAIPRVRANDSAALAKLLQEGTNRSSTFRRLVGSIDRTDGLVYVQEGHCGHHVRACLALTVQVAGSNRLLRIVVDAHRDRDELIAAIGHELQHAVEALGDPHVRDERTIYSFFDRIGATDRGRFETQAAIQTGLDVLAELKSGNARRRKADYHPET